MQVILEKPVSRDGGYRLCAEGDRIMVSCDFLFDATTDERTQIKATFDRRNYVRAVESLAHGSTCCITNRDGAFLRLKVKNKREVTIHFGKEGAPQLIVDQTAQPSDFMPSRRE